MPIASIPKPSKDQIARIATERLFAVKQQLNGFTSHLKPGSQYDSGIDSIYIIVLRNYI